MLVIKIKSSTIKNGIKIAVLWCGRDGPTYFDLNLLRICIIFSHRGSTNCKKKIFYTNINNKQQFIDKKM